MRGAQETHQFVLGDILLIGGDRNDLLCRHVERVQRDFDFVEMPLADGADRRGAFGQVVDGERKKSPFRRRTEAMTGAAYALDRGRDRSGRVDLADQIDRADVDAKLERSGGHDGLELAALEALFGGKAFGACEAAMMRHNRIGTDALLQSERNPLGPSAREREDQRRAMLANEVSNGIVHRLPMRMGRERPELGSGRDDRQIEFAPGVVGAHDSDWARRARAVGGDFRSGEKCGERFDWIERRRETNAHRSRRPTLPDHSFQALQRERQMSAALVAGDRVELVNDDVANGSELGAKARRGQEDEQRFGRGDEDVRRPSKHRGALIGGRIAGAQPRTYRGERQAHLGSDFAHTVERLLEVEADVVGQRL